MTTTEAAKRLGLTKQGVHFLIDTKRLKANRKETALGWYWDVAESEVKKLAAERERGGRK